MTETVEFSALMEVAKHGAEGGESPVDASKKIVDGWYKLGLPVDLTVLDPFIGIVSQSDHVPLNLSLQDWGEADGKRIVLEKNQLDEAFNDPFRSACSRLVFFLSNVSF